MYAIKVDFVGLAHFIVICNAHCMKMFCLCPLLICFIFVFQAVCWLNSGVCY